MAVKCGFVLIDEDDVINTPMSDEDDLLVFRDGYKVIGAVFTTFHCDALDLLADCGKFNDYEVDPNPSLFADSDISWCGADKKFYDLSFVHEQRYKPNSLEYASIVELMESK